MSWNPNTPNVGVVDEGEEGSVQNALWRYMEYTRIRGYTRQTRYGYARYGQDFVNWCTDAGIRSLSEMTTDVLSSYQHMVGRLRKRNGHELAVRSQLSKLIPVRAFFRWLGREHAAAREALAQCELPKAPRTLPRALLSPKEILRLLQQPDVETAVGLRDRAVLELFYGVGLRRAELLGLAIDDLDCERMQLMIREGKGGRDRIVPVGAQAMQWLEQYLHQARPRFVDESRDDDQRLFIGRRGKTLSPNWMSGLVNGYLRKIRPGKPGACHLLRHSMATTMLENNADIRYIQAMLGHAQLSSTQIYTHVSMSHLRRVYEATHPSARRQDKGSRRSPPRHPLQRVVQTLLADLPLNATMDDLAALIEKVT